MITRGKRTRLAIFLLVIAGLLIAFLSVVGGQRLLERRASYVIAYKGTSVSGLQVGSAVRYQGVDVGSVEDIRFSPTDIRTVLVTISVRKDTPVRTDVKAMLMPVGITGLMQVELTGRSNTAPPAPPGFVIEGGQSPLDRILAPAETIANKLDTILGNISELMSADNQARFNRILSNVDVFVAETRDPMAAVIRNLQSTTASLAVTVGSVNKLLGSLDRTVTDADVAEVSKNLNQTISQARDAITNIDLTVLRSRRDVVDSIAALRETVQYLSDFALLISENPSLLIRQRARGQ